MRVRNQAEPEVRHVICNETWCITCALMPTVVPHAKSKGLAAILCCRNRLCRNLLSLQECFVSVVRLARKLGAALKARWPLIGHGHNNGLPIAVSILICTRIETRNRE